MVRSRVVAGLLSVASLACSEETGGWVRVERVSEPEPFDGLPRDTYLFVHSNREADFCVRFVLETPTSYNEPDPRDIIELRGADLVLAAAAGGEYSRNCTGEWVQNGPNAVTGKIKFEHFNGAGLPCRVSYDLRLEERFEAPEGFEDEFTYVNQTYEVVARDVPIAAVDCPREPIYAGEYRDLDAAYGEYQGVDTLVISAWDEAREVCVWARFLAGVEAGELDANEVEAPGEWVYGGLRFGLTAPDECVASDFVAPPTGTPYATESVAPLGSTGALRFVDELDGVPCSVDVELELWSLGRFDWTPDDVIMRGTNVPVVGACE